MIPVYYNEYDQKAAAWLRELIKAGSIPAGDVDERSITEVQPNDVKGYRQAHFFAGIGGWAYALQLAGWSDRPVWTGSCPCQSLSVAGLGRGADDDRHLWPAFARLISDCQPEVIFGEQVASKLSRSWLAGVFADLEAMGYFTDAADLCAAGIGAPHIRQRLWWVADAGRDRRQAADIERENGVKTNAVGQTDVSRMRGSSGGLADANPERLESQREGIMPEQGGELEDARRPESDRRESLRSRMGNTISSRLQGHAGHEPDRNEPGRIDADQARPVTETSGDSGIQHAEGDGRKQGRAKPVRRGVASGCGSPWSGDYTPCADGKSRRIITRPIWLVARIPGIMARCSNDGFQGEVDGQTAKTNTGAVLPELRHKTGKETIQDRDRGSVSLHKKKILRSEVHGTGDDRGNQGQVSEKQPPAVSQDGCSGLLDLWEHLAATGSPRRHESDEQRTVESGNIVLALSYAETLARMEKDEVSEKALFALRAACEASGLVQYTLDALLEAWRSLKAENLEGQTMGVDSGYWIIRPINPLIVGLKGRTAMLRGYGNSIVPPLAAEFIKAYMESIKAR